MYDPVMSQEINTVLGSCGLMLGLNIAPPPPGPMTLKSPGRAANANPASREQTIRARVMFAIRCFRLLSLSLLQHCPAIGLKCQRQSGEALVIGERSCVMEDS